MSPIFSVSISPLGKPSELLLMKSNHIKRVLSPLKGNISLPSQGQKTCLSTNGEAGARSYKDVVNRTVYSLIMAYTSLAFISKGVEVVTPILIVVLCTMFHEISRINQQERKNRQLPSVLILKLWFLCNTMFLVVVNGIREPLTTSFPDLVPYYRNIGKVAFGFPLVGMVGFVLSLRKGMYRYQFIQLAWIVMSLLYVAAQGYVQISNMMRGMIWFLLPISCVVNNDIWAYVFGKLFGRTRLLALSPKKTVEGFVGAFLFTTIWSFWFAGFLSYFPLMYCPKTDFHSAMQCEKDPLFVQRDVALPPFLKYLTFGCVDSVRCSKVQQHALVFGVLASLVAPFGGFFASGLKRAFKLKDFGDLIPGHGGMTDRMDCQSIMGFLTWVYVENYVYYDLKCPSWHALSSCVLQLSEEKRRWLLTILNESFSEHRS